MSSTYDSPSSFASPNRTFTLKNANSSIIQLISGQQAVKELQKTDDYIANLSQFDLECRLNLPSPTIEDYFKFIEEKVVNWSEKSAQAIASCIEFTNTNYEEQLNLLKFPPEIYVVLTNGKDENNAAYCRNENVIVIPLSITLLSDMNKIFIHELFHIWSRWPDNLTIRDKLYASIGFHKIPVQKSIEVPENLEKIKMTNPDAPLLFRYYIELKKLGDESGKAYKCTPILHATQEFNPEFSLNFFQYLNPTTLILDDITYEPIKPLQYLAYNEASDFFDQIGRNTFYIIHPEEILADNFALWMMNQGNSSTTKSPMVISKMGDIFAAAARE